jgi:hypothetical protein
MRKDRMSNYDGQENRRQQHTHTVAVLASSPSTAECFRYDHKSSFKNSNASHMTLSCCDEDEEDEDEKMSHD